MFGFVRERIGCARGLVSVGVEKSPTLRTLSDGVNCKVLSAGRTFSEVKCDNETFYILNIVFHGNPYNNGNNIE